MSRTPDPNDQQIQADQAALRTITAQGARTLSEIADKLPPQPSGATVKRHSRPNRWLRIAVATGLLTLAAGGVYAATTGTLFSLWVDPQGMTDEQVEDEIHEQLADDGITDTEVSFERDGDETYLDIRGYKGDQELRILVQNSGSDDSGDATIALSPPQFDVEREPGMTDAQLKAKIEAQLSALGLSGEVTVAGDDIDVQVSKIIEVVTDKDDDDSEADDSGDH